MNDSVDACPEECAPDTSDGSLERHTGECGVGLSALGLAAGFAGFVLGMATMATTGGATILAMGGAAVLLELFGLSMTFVCLLAML